MIVIASGILIFAVIWGMSRNNSNETVLLEWGWHTPSLQQMARYSELDSLPFDGLILDADTNRPLGWGMTTNLFINEQIPQSEFDDIYLQARDIEWGHLRHNFLEMTIYPADVDWFDDFDTILANIEAWARLSHDLGFVGIFFDTEQYAGVDIFDYDQRPHNDQFTWDEYAQQAHNRGAEVMAALNRGHPGLTVIFTFGLSSQFDLPGSYGLLYPFLEGMLGAAENDNVLIDGFEQSYRYREEKDFAAAREFVKEELPPYRAHLELGFGLWLDHDCQEVKSADCGYSGDEFTDALNYAASYSDGYIWIWSQYVDWYEPDAAADEWLQVFRRFQQGKLQSAPIR